MQARCLLAILVVAAAFIQANAAPATVPGASAPVVVKVMIVNMFQLEAAPWLSALHAVQDVPVPGLSSDYPAVHCTPGGVCQMTTGMGHANAAASMMAVLFSGRFDLTKTYFVIAGIGGIDPDRGTLGSAAWARYVIDAGIAHEIDARDLPAGWQDGYFGISTDAADQVPKFEYQTEMFQLDEPLLQKALAFSRPVTLEDVADIRAYRRHYRQAAARAPPAVIQCDTLSSDTWWSGRRLGEHARHWTLLLTHGAGNYCTSQQEDNATLNALTRASRSALVDLKRVAVLRTASDFDRPYPRQSAFESLRAQRALPGAIRASTDNLLRAAMPLVEEISVHWDRWAGGVPQ
jgi:purine nucleoside permease